MSAQPYTSQFIAQVIGQALEENAWQRAFGTPKSLNGAREYMQLVARQLCTEKQRRLG